MDAGKRTLNEIFNGSRVLEIPFFQRSYVWDEEQWVRLLEDVESVSKNKEPYFLGSVILKQQSTSTKREYGDIRTVIDGQQRLTTLSILLKVLSLKNNQMDPFNRRFRLDDGSIVLKHNHNDIESFLRIMNLTEEIDIEHTDNISRAYKYFKDNLNPELINFQTITNAMILVAIDLSHDEDEQQIFDTINSLGVKLTTAELLKNYFFDRNDLSKYEKYWKKVFELDEESKFYWDIEVTTGRYKRSFIDIFFYSYLQIKIQISSYFVKTEDKILFSKVDKLFDSYKKFIEKYYKGEKESILKEIREYAKIFKRTFDTEIIKDELTEKSGIERINAIIFGLETTTLIPYVLYIEKNIIDEDMKNELYGFLETFIMRRLISKASNKNYNQLFSDRLIYNKILSHKDFIEFLEKQDDKVNYLPSNEEMRDAFKNNILANKQAKGVLYFIESKIRDRTKHSTQLLGLDKYGLEHIMPKKWQNHWDRLEEQYLIDKRNRTLLTFGNLTIITQSLNRSIRDANWDIKKYGDVNKPGLYKYGKGIDTLDEFLEEKEWNEDTIDKRADFLLKKALEVWSYKEEARY